MAGILKYQIEEHEVLSKQGLKWISKQDKLTKQGEKKWKLICEQDQLSKQAGSIKWEGLY